MKGFIVDSSYRIINDKPYVFLFGKLENKETFVFIKHFKPYFFIKESDLNKAKKVEKFESEKVDLKDFDGKKVVKILVDKPSDVIHVREIFSDANISTYEADIRYAQRFILDNELRSSVDITGDYEYQDDIRVYKDAEIKSSDWKPNLKVLSLDIETNAKTGEIYVVSVATDNVKKSFVNNQKVKGTVFCKDEEEVIEKFVNSIKEIDPDVITGWNLIDFDLKHLQERARKYNFDLMIGRDGSKINLRIVSDFFKNSTADVAGRVVVDALNLIRSSFIKLDDYKLETVAQEFLGKGKLLNFKNIDKYEEINRLYKENPSKLVAYNLLDAELPLEILKESGALDLAIQKSFLTGMNLDKVSASIASLDSLYLPKARKKGLVCNTLHYNVKEKRIMGGFVMESKPGIYDNILVLDFKSLYPSIIKTFNIDPSSFIKSCKGKDLVKAPNGACFRNEEGILPEIISELWLEREKVRKQKNELARYAIKILMNSFFGVLASPNCRFFNMKVANAITHFGQHLNKLTTKIIEKKGYEVIYGDSVKGNRFITLLNPNGLIEIIKIEDFFNKFSQNHFKLRGKDFTSPQGYKALTLNPKTHKSEFKKIKRIIKHKVKKDVYRIIQKFGETEVTSDHSLICWDKGKLRTIKPKEVHKYQMASIMAIPKLKQVKKIDLYDYLKKIQYKIKYKGREKLARVKIDGDYLIFGWTNQNNSIKLKRFVKVGTKEFESLCRLLGAYIGDGSSSTLDTTNSRSGASIANSDKKLLIQLKKDYERLFLNAKVSIILSTKKSRLLKYKTPQGVWKEIIYEDKTMKLQMMNQISAIFFKALAGQKSIAKKLPDFIYHVPEEFQELLLDYLIKTDGSRAVNKKLGYSPVYKQKNFSYITQSLELISGITFLLRQLKKNYSLNFRPEKKAYTIRTSDKINIKLQTKIKKEKFSGYVYDLEVEDNHMFVDSCGQILLHNTDSIFVKSKAKSLQEAEKIGKELEIYINNYYDKHIKKEYKRKSFLEMEYEKCYSKFLMPKLRKSEAGAKKRYAGLLKGKLDIVGLEAVRGDWTKLAKEFQEELLEKLFKGEDLEKYIRDFVAKLRKGKLDELLVYTKSLRKPLKDYLKTTPPHVKAARLLDKLESKRIDYVITDEGPEPIQKIKHSIDYEHYINKQLKPLADSILTFFNSDFEDVLKGNKQKSLSSFS